MMNRIEWKFLIVALLFIFSCSQPVKYTKPTIEIQTYFGDIIVELYPEKAPKTVAAFLSYIDSGFYKNTSFYRVLKKEDQPAGVYLWQINLVNTDNEKKYAKGAVTLL